MRRAQPLAERDTVCVLGYGYFMGFDMARRAFSVDKREARREWRLAFRGRTN